MTPAMRGGLLSLDRALRLLSYGIAAASVVVFPLARFTDRLPAAWIGAFATVAGVCGAALFSRLLFDPRTHRVLAAANAEIEARRRDLSLSLFDLGSRGGTGVLPWLRLVLFVEFMAAVVVQHPTGPTVVPSMIAFAGVWITIMLTHLHIVRQASLQPAPMGA